VHQINTTQFSEPYTERLLRTPLPLLFTLTTLASFLDLATMMGPLQSTSAMPPTPTQPVEHRRQRKDFEFRHGHKLHTYDKAPYPLSYNRMVLELCAFCFLSLSRCPDDVQGIAGQCTHSLSQGLCLLRTVHHPPKTRLGSGLRGASSADGPTSCSRPSQTGTWIIEAAKQWPDCHFVRYYQPKQRLSYSLQVGLDLVNIQLDLKYLPYSISSRIEYRYGNL